MASDIWCSIKRCIAGDAVVVRCKFVLLVLVLLAYVSDLHAEIQGPSPDFSRHTLIRPRVYHGRTKRELSSTKENDLDHADVLTIGFDVDGVQRILDLRLNTDLLPVSYKQLHQHQGTYKEHGPSKVELCHYQGSVRDVPTSWVALSTCRGLRGVIFDGENLHHIHPEDESLDSAHYIYNQKDLIANNTCGYEGTPHHVLDRDHRELLRISRHKRATEEVRGPYNANRQSRYVELVLVIDKKEYLALDKNLDKVYHHCKDIANIINALYVPLNIFIALVGVQVWSDTDEITLSPNGDTTLSNFLEYRRKKLLKDMPNDNAQLLTKIQFEGGVVGKALKGPICTYEFSGGVSMDHSTIVGLVAATMAHEMGHNFGMEHDSADCECPEEKCIMAPSSGSSGPIHWSTCSLEHLALAFEHGMDYCLRNKPQKLFDSPICGNGFVESGEQCDCGLKANCDNPCCNATTCMLHANASCATGACCDLKTCKPKTAGTECRSAEHECDLPEYCTGQSEYCPTDVFKMDGETCSMGKAFCYQGSCRTHNDQCKLLWGPTGSSSDDQCYDMNNRGTKHGNCGFNRIDSSYIKCNDENLMCGMLHCKHLNERLEFGMESVAILSHSFINNGGKIIPCRSAIVDLGLNQVDPGLAPDGAKCAPGKMCVNQKCMPVAALRASISAAGKACPNNCSGNGVCNSRGHCHCHRGFRPPDCTQPGVGGSEDSGPAEDPNARTDFMTALYVIFLGVVPVIGLSFGVWYMKNSGGQHWKKGMMSTNDRGHNGLSIKTIDRSSPMPRNIETIDSSLAQDPACASLLPKTEEDERYNNNLFGHFKGFTITPLRGQTKLAEPTKPAPPPPTIPTVAIKTNVKVTQKNNTAPPRPSVTSAVTQNSNESAPPTLPPLNPGSTSRPLISSPVLAATTCTSVELVTPKIVQKTILDVPTRPAPAPPDSVVPVVHQKPQRPNSTPLANVIVPVPEPERKVDKGGTLNRIASILRPNSGIVKHNFQFAQKDEKNTNSLPRSQHQKANKVLDKEILRNLEISNPIPQTEIEIPAAVISVIPAGETGEKKNVVLRAQSMRDAKVTPRPNIHTFGSMRQTTPVKRPTSIPASTRPTSPPPGPPVTATSVEKANENTIKIPGLPGYQNPPMKSIQRPVENTYDDCMNLMAEPSLTKIVEESPSNDNIYAVIEEAVPEKNRKNMDSQNQNLNQCDNEYKSPKRIETSSPNSNNGMESMGLLSEIVSEISSRNFDSIYSTSTLARKNKKKEEESIKNTDNLGSNSSLGAYANSNHYKSPGSLYSNSASGKFNSSSSTTSSGYLNPSAVNIPQLNKEQLNNKDDKSETRTGLKALDKNKLTTLNSNNPNVNDDISKELGMKPAEDNNAAYKPYVSSNRTTLSLLNSKKDEKKVDKFQEQNLTKPPLKRTKTPPNIAKNVTSKEAQDSNAKSARQNSDTALKSAKRLSEHNLQSASQESQNGNTEISKQNSDGNFKNKQTSNSTKPNNGLSRTNSNADKDETCVTSPKSVPCSPKNNPEKLNSPDLVSSCSNSNQNTVKSPDVLGNNPRTVVSRSVQKTPALTKAAKAPSMPTKPLSISSNRVSSALVDKKKSPTTNAKSLPSSNKEVVSKTSPTKLPQKPETKVVDAAKTNPVQKAANSKSNVASLQQKFEANKNASVPRTLLSVNKKSAGKVMELAGVKK